MSRYNPYPQQGGPNQFSNGRPQFDERGPPGRGGPERGRRSASPDFNRRGGAPADDGWNSRGGGARGGRGGSSFQSHQSFDPYSQQPPPSDPYSNYGSGPPPPGSFQGGGNFDRYAPPPASMRDGPPPPGSMRDVLPMGGGYNSPYGGGNDRNYGNEGGRGGYGENSRGGYGSDNRGGYGSGDRGGYRGGGGGRGGYGGGNASPRNYDQGPPSRDNQYPPRGGGNDRGGGSDRGGGNDRGGGSDRGGSNDRGGGMRNLPPPGVRRDFYRQGHDDDDGVNRGNGGMRRAENSGRGNGGGAKREKPCRTLFIRNLKFETSSEEVRMKFDMMGEVKTFFDLIEKRGMVFITYYDLRAAVMAKEKLQGTEVSGRSIDVHYSLPRDADRARRCDRDKNQGSLTLNIPDASSKISDSELHALFSTKGDIKGIYPAPEKNNQTVIDFFDTRACERAFDELNGKPMAGGSMDLRFAWDILVTDVIEAVPVGVAELAAPIAGSVNERLSQAQKVQQLLSALSSSQASTPSYQTAPPPEDVKPQGPPPLAAPMEVQALLALLAQNNKPQ